MKNHFGILLSMFISLVQQNSVAEGQQSPNYIQSITDEDLVKLEAATPSEILDLKDRANGGDPASQLELGDRYHFGAGVPQDRSLSIPLYRQSASQGNVDAMFNLGVAYDKAEGVKYDPERAAAYYKKAADRGHVRAKYNYAVLLSEGRGVELDLNQAIHLYRQAAEAGFSRAQFNLANMLSDGRAIEQMPAESEKWYVAAAKQGYVEAQFNLALQYAEGAYGEIDNVSAFYMMMFAAERPSHLQTEALRTLDILASRMTSDELERARRAFVSCAHSNPYCGNP